MSQTLAVTNLPNPRLAFTNRVYVNKSDFDAYKAWETQIVREKAGEAINLRFNGQWVFLVVPIDGIAPGEVGLNSQQRKCGQFMLGQQLTIEPFLPNAQVALSSISLTVDLFIKKEGTKVNLDGEELTNFFKETFAHQVFTARQQLALNFNGSKLDVMVESLDHAEIPGVDGIASPLHARREGQVLPTTQMKWHAPTGNRSVIISKAGADATDVKKDLFRSDFNFEQMGIGGLDEQFKKMFRTAFASRMFPGVVKELGTNHVRGILLYGPPGCGKTLIARQIGNILNAREPKIINGPEVLDKFVGGSEEKIRALFEDAEKEQQEMGDNSMLHIIIFDEMDAIMKTRGSTRDNTGVSDSIVNQLLSKIDGVDSLNNILIIGMTNRLDMIDEAILRPGRLEIHIEISLPSEDGRLQILQIKTANMKKNKRITQEVLDGLPEFAHRTKNYTGAELEGLVRNAASFALARNVDASKMKAIDPKNLMVEKEDFERAIVETVPAFGNKDNSEIQSNYLNGVCDYGPSFQEMWRTLERLRNQTKHSDRTPLMSVILEGAVSSGKTALAAKLAAESDFPFVRMISADSLIGTSESTRCAKLMRIFTDSYKSPLSIIFIDDIERLIEYSPVGPRFSNSVLQTLLVLLRKTPPQPSRLMVVATTAVAHLLEDLQLIQAFNVSMHVSQLQSASEIAAVLKEYAGDCMSPAEVKSICDTIGNTKPIGIKQLLMVLEMARAEEEENVGYSGASADQNTDAAPKITVSANSFLSCLQTAGF